MNIHFIAIGGSAMHNLAIALHQKGEKVSGSDDTIHEPSNRDWKNMDCYLKILVGFLKKSMRKLM